jgi:copper transport protein
MSVLALPDTAWAHARLRKSEPAASARLTTSPHVVRLWFTEAPELSLTTVTLLDSAGASLDVGKPERDADGVMAVRVPIGSALPPGRYTVKWRTAAADGHPLSGTFTFRVTVPAGDSITARGRGTGASTPPDSVRPQSSPVAPMSGMESADAEPGALNPAFVVVRALAFVALLALIGAVAFRWGVVSRAEGLEQHVRDGIAGATASRALLVSVVFLIAAATKLYLQNRMMSGEAGMDAAHMEAMAMGTHWGAAWRLQLGAGVLALAGFLVARRGAAAGWVIAALASLALAASAALGAHAAAAQRLHTVSIVADSLHVIAAAGWLGSLLWLVVTGIPRFSSPNEGHWPRVAALVRAFSPMALSFAALVTVTGVTSAWLRLGTVPALWGTMYGQVLLLKLAVLSGVAATGLHNWKRVQPALGTEGATIRLARTATIELVIGLLVIIVTAVLVALPTPLT